MLVSLLFEQSDFCVQHHNKDHKGFITVMDLKRVVEEVNEHWEEMGLDHPMALGEEQLQAMIEDFDGNLDGMIDQEDFGKIMRGL